MKAIHERMVENVVRCYSICYNIWWIIGGVIYVFWGFSKGNKKRIEY